MAARKGGCGAEPARPSTVGSEDKGRTRQIQPREVAGARGELGRGAHWRKGRLLCTAQELARPNIRRWGREAGIPRIWPPHHNMHRALATRGADRTSGPMDQSSNSVSLVSILAFGTYEARPPWVPRGICPCHAQRLSQTPGKSLPGGGENY